MLPAETIAAISNVIALKLEPRTTMAIVGAILTPLLTDADGPPRARRSQSHSRRAPQRKKPKRRAPRSAEARERARAALKANPDATLTAVAKLAKVSRSTVVNARDEARRELAAEARRTSRDTTPALTKQTERRQRAQQFLKDALAHGPKRVTDVEEAATKAHIDDQLLAQARADLGIVVSRSSAGGVQAVQWSLPG